MEPVVQNIFFHSSPADYLRIQIRKRGCNRNGLIITTEKAKMSCLSLCIKINQSIGGNNPFICLLIILMAHFGLMR